MEKLIRYGSAEAIPYYNCSAKTPEEWVETGVRRPFLGIILLSFGLLAEIAYVPVIYSMFRLKLVYHSCYKVMVLLAVTDMFATVLSALLSGIFFINGVVYCMYPNLTYIAGCFGIGFWCMSCANTLVLVINRVCTIWSPNTTSSLFKGKNIYVVFFFPISYGLYVIFFTSPAIFNSAVMAWINDPLTIYENKPPEALNMYNNIVQDKNNWIYMFSICILYAIYYWKIVNMQDGQNSKASKQVFIQASLICFFNTTTALIYNLMHFINPSPAIICFGEISWAIVHGIPAFIYLIMNKSIRKHIFRCMGIKRTETSKVAAINSIF